MRATSTVYVILRYFKTLDSIWLTVQIMKLPVK